MPRASVRDTDLRRVYIKLPYKHVSAAYSECDAAVLYIKLRSCYSCKIYTYLKHYLFALVYVGTCNVLYVRNIHLMKG
jgi:hypothetical protein